MINVWFIKNILETFLVHRMSGINTSLNRTIWQVMFYWIGLGGVVGFSLYHPLYDERQFPFIDDSDNMSWRQMVILGVFFFSMIMSVLAHCHFSNMTEMMAKAVLKDYMTDDLNNKSKSRRNFIIKSMSRLATVNDYGYNLVTSADYLCELISVMCILLIIQTMSGYLFGATLAYWRFQKAKERHDNYRAEYGINYPDERKLLIPYLI